MQSENAEANVDWSVLHGGAFDRARILVTGGAGFIGSHLCEALVSLGSHVIALDDLSGGDAANVDFGSRANLPGQVDFVQGSILDVPLLGRVMSGCSLVFHQAALGSVPRSVAEPRLFHDVNSTGTLNVLEAARAAGVRRVMFAASSSAYGDTEVLPKIETMPASPMSPYAANKVAGEALIAAYAASLGVDGVALRYFNIFGPRQNANSAYAAVIAAFAKAMLSGKPPIIHGDGEQSRDFTYVANVVHANLLAARSREPLGGRVINVACGTRVTVNELAKTMAAALGTNVQPVHSPSRAGDVRHSLADLGRARAVLRYEPIVGFEPGLRETVRWYATEHSK